MTARIATNAIQHRIFTRTGVSLSFDDANTLRRAELTLQRWSEQECGDGNAYQSWAIERDETTDKPYMVYYRFTEKEPRRYRIPDREKGALKRIAEICKRNGLHFFHQTDPRGCALYVHNQPLPDNNYNQGVAVCA